MFEPYLMYNQSKLRDDNDGRPVSQRCQRSSFYPANIQTPGIVAGSTGPFR